MPYLYGLEGHIYISRLENLDFFMQKSFADICIRYIMRYQNKNDTGYFDKTVVTMQKNLGRSNVMEQGRIYIDKARQKEIRGIKDS